MNMIDIKTYGKVINSLKEFRREIMLYVKDGMLIFQGVHSSNVMYLKLQIPIQDATDSEQVCVLTTDLCQKLSVFKGDTVFLIEDAEIVITNKEGTKKTKVRLLEPEYEIKDYEPEFPCKYTIPEDMFKEIIDLTKIEEQRLIFTCEEGVLKVKGDGIEFDTVQKIDVTEKHESRISADFLQLASKFVSGDVTIQFKDAYPMMITDDNTQIVLAPRVENT